MVTNKQNASSLQAQGIDKLIINSPYKCPSQHWNYNRASGQFELVKTRREAGYFMPKQEEGELFGDFIRIKNVDAIRQRVDAWRQKGYPSVSGVTKKLLTHWHQSKTRNLYPLFFCQLEAIETIIWEAEVHRGERDTFAIPLDDKLKRRCTKMATGTGKTIVMAMVIAWQIINNVKNPKNKTYSKDILIVTPGLTVKNRLAVLNPQNDKNYYDEFNLVPSSFYDYLRRGRVLIQNWHRLDWETEEKIKTKRGVDKRGAKSDRAYMRAVLGTMADAKRLLVINDEAHHAWRVSRDAAKTMKQEDINEATKWVGALDRINKAIGIVTCYDFSATPFPPSSRTSQMTAEENLFPWIISDFNLNDAIESGLVKTPIIPIDDNTRVDTTTNFSRFFHLYNDEDVKKDINRKATAK